MGITTVKGFFEHLFNSSVKQLSAKLRTLESNAFLIRNLLILGLIKS